MQYCYRDTNMEIQGLSHAQNIHCQHGAPQRTGSYPLRTTTGARSLSISNENETQEDSESLELQSDNNNRTRTSTFRLLAENGSVLCLPVCKQKGINNSPLQTQTANVGLRNMNTLKARELLRNMNTLKAWELNAKRPPHDFFRTGYKYEIESGDKLLQMALPFFAGEEEQYQQQQVQPPVLRQQHEDGASLLQSLSSESTTNANKNTEEYYVVFNIVQDDGNGADKDGNPYKDGDTLNGNMKLEHSKINQCNSMEFQTTSSTLIESDDNLNNLAAETLKRTVHLCSLLNSSSNSEGEATVTNEKPSVCYETGNEKNDALTNEYVENLCGHQVCIENIDSNTSDQLSSQIEAQDSIALISENTDIVEMSDAIDLIYDTGRSLSANADATESFSGTIMINNQSIIVTIENGILTLAAPPDGYTHKDDGMFGLKEHLGMKDHEDIVLLNFDSGTKSIGKISNMAGIRAVLHEQSRLDLTVSDSELALADNCSLSEMGLSLETCPVIKQESRNLCAISEGDLVSQRPEGSSVDNDGFQPVSIIGALGLSKKGALVTMYCCPQPGCTSTFDTRQKLKMHLLNHTEDQRPFKCTFEGCGWAFTTSYKLKRHLQSHDKVRPHKCEWEGCGRCFTTVYNLKAHVKQHDQENTFVCEICSERFRSATRLTNHQRAHFEPERPHKCEFPGCEKNFITYSALFSHNRTHFRETGQFICAYPGCDKRYDKACRIKIHMRSHTGERPFVCDSEACGWSFTSMSKLLRHKRKHDDDRRFTCPEEGCGKSFTRAEHLKGHSITHLGTKPFECHVDGCSAKFSARSSLYIHSKKHKQDAGSLRTSCPVANCSKHFSSRNSLKSHMLKHHHLNPDVLSQLEVTPTLTPSSELVSASTTTGTGSGGDQLAHLDLSSLFSAVPGGPVPVRGTRPVGAFAMDLSLVSSGILAIDPASVGSALCTSGHGATVAKASLEPLILAAGEDMVGGVLPSRGTLHLEDVQTVTPEALGSLTVLTMQAASSSADHHILSSSSALSPEPFPSTLAVPPGPGLLSSPSKVAEAGGSRVGSRPRLDCVEVLGQHEADKVLTQFKGHRGGSTFSPQKDSVLSHISAYSFLESSGSARTDYRAIQLAKNRKQSGPTCSASSGLCQRKSKGGKASSASVPMVPTSTCFVEGSAAANGGLTICDPVTGAQYVQIQLLQDDPASEGDLAFQLSSQPSSSHSQLTVDLPVNILQEPPAMTEEDNGSDNSQFTGSTINLQDLE
ncbi:LOW QUALITY PROTEIN: zinc finger protein ZXDC-like [Salvelinus fontinalis]|uniref:LOW QUALITY PROTEIN: zinc finger protein ZXDC-like n=1 Tax=Salvelinus fontinalis TaxID=8038 RepID=UPI002484E5F7|nr:LOW QUALITY PROTEIN: zinc finger protein ZXDC-like [Salvelinus fontinalis]